MQCLREHTDELDFLCVKTVDGRCAEVDFSMMPGVSFHMHKRPTYRSSSRAGLVMPDMSKLLMAASGTSSEAETGDHPSNADRGMPVTDEYAAWTCLPCVLICCWACAAGTEVGNILQQVHEWLGGIACGISGTAMHIFRYIPKSL